jgi:hypothetical protein
MRAYEDVNGISLLYDLLNVMEQDETPAAISRPDLYNSIILDFIDDTE